ncbi:SDR family oxidoreductase [Cellvibrio japonicus]|uniref:Oxidoreductase, short chain dehydrogenase/reductase family n=1 Tax=Cellvibrio japonicus (strain Ueda107) TaxID=498211 RepID=B3PEX4_CELJU|nr:SDR family oxidoreductase [Cellvibrio japonicus]ACE83547.1 oxidoreductase, short chain dehydrogenase/reductase family [Cellvibrio japonicus Ueda107]QEI12221.1 SDR family oxidoreductase [Cellvibrio japonicus]QEI15795.1 SDR family oxidoreductase [Cellvibrio japonicus]QEI19373.1 SDR family oxidoreductase [Cellvibrio japonicus]
MHKSILMTGCSTGIGYYAAQQLRARGYQVIASCRQLHDVERLRSEGFLSVHLDLNDSSSIHSAVQETLTLTGGNLFALFNNGAYGQPGAIEDLSRDSLRRQFETNVFGWVELTNLLLPVMLKQGNGRIIQNSSVLGIAAMPLRGAYNASKYAIEGITDTLRLELMGSGVHISLIEPGPIRSQFRHNALKALNDNINMEQSRHHQTYQKAIERLAKQETTTPFTLGPEAVYKRLLHALESPRPQVRYYVTFPTYLVGFMKRVLPSRWLDRLVKAMGN